MRLPRHLWMGYGSGHRLEIHGENAADRNRRWRALANTWGPKARQPRTPVNYYLNSDSYRAPEWDTVDWAKSVVFFGCSEMFGVAIDTPETVPAIYTQLTGIPSVNCGRPGASNGEIAELVEAVLEMTGTKPAAVVVAWAPLERLHIRYHDRYYTVGPWNVDDPHQFDDSGTIGAWKYCTQQYRQQVMHDAQLMEEFDKWRNHVKQSVPDDVALIEYSGIEPATRDITGQTWWEPCSWLDFARDGHHSNGRRNRRLVNQLLRNYPHLPGYLGPPPPVE